MTRQSLIQTAAWAVGTFALVLAFGLPQSLDAGNPDVAANGRVDQPVVRINGIDLTVQTAMSDTTGTNAPATRPDAVQAVNASTPSNGSAAAAASKTITIRVLASNSADTAAIAPFTLHLMVSAMVSPISRSLPRPTETWSQSGQFSLAPGERSELTMTTPLIRQNQQWSLQVESGGQRQIVATGTTPGGELVVIRTGTPSNSPVIASGRQ
jgi:hypothetical protein